MNDSLATEQCIAATFAAYVECALWSSTDEDGAPLGDTADDLAPETLEEMRADVEAFLEIIWSQDLDLSPIEPEQIGQDFWLTRNRHGAGFWDRGLGELGETLTQFAQSYGSCDLYVSDDGLVRSL